MAAKKKWIPTPQPDIEVIDAAGSPLLVMPQDQVLRQKLRHKTVLVCLQNVRGNIFLYKPMAETSGDMWLPGVYGRVFAGESRHDAAIRLLDHGLGITGLDIAATARFTELTPGTVENVDITLFLTAKTSAIPRPREQEGREGMFVDREELRAIARDYPDMLPSFWTPALAYFFAD